jgi:hypothetical protein
MIRYSLTCKDGHSFDSWFQNAEAFGALQATRQLACPVCGAVEVEKALMAPAVVPGRAVVEARVKEPADPPSLRDPQSEIEAAIAALRRQIEENSEYVGLNFASEARQMHEGDSPVRAIHGEARPEEARKLIEDGVPVAPLPFLPTRKVN